MNNERFMVPEALFHPSDIGMNQAGAHPVLNDTHVPGGARRVVDRGLTACACKSRRGGNDRARRGGLPSGSARFDVLQCAADRCAYHALCLLSAFHYTYGLLCTLNTDFARHLYHRRALLIPMRHRVGGTTRCPGFRERLEAELRPLVPEHLPLTVRAAADPVIAAWQGGVQVANSPAFRKQAITKHEYDEQGSHRLHYHAAPA